MDQIIAILNQVMDFFKNNETVAQLIDMLKGFIEQFMGSAKTEA